MNLTEQYDRYVRDAQRHLDDAKRAATKALILVDTLAMAGLTELPPPNSTTHHGVALRWALMVYNRGCGNGCGEVSVSLADEGIVWSWESRESLVQYYPGSNRPLVRTTPEFVTNVPRTTVVSPEAPREFVEFVKKHVELMYSREAQEKRKAMEAK